MEQTVIEYLGSKLAPFDEEPLNEVDSLVLATVAYYRFEHGALSRVVASEFLELPVAVCGIQHEDLYGGIWLSSMRGDEFLAALLASPRFAGLKIGRYANVVSDHFEKQFSAVTFLLPGDTAYIAYRGTDNTLAGWKEDFNLTYMDEVPSQASARSYLEDTAEALHMPLFVGGHSKGGNLAEYATLTSRDSTFDRIVRVFNHDGPGFSSEPSERIRSAEYASKLSKTVPGASVFGMLMENRDCWRAVKSSGMLFAQHAATHWAVEGDNFVAAEGLSPEAAVISGTLTRWAFSYEPAERELFIDAVYGILRAADAGTLSEIWADKPGSALAVASAVAKLPSQMRSTLLDMVRDIVPILGAEAVGSLETLLLGERS